MAEAATAMRMLASVRMRPTPTMSSQLPQSAPGSRQGGVAGEGGAAVPPQQAQQRGAGGAGRGRAEFLAALQPLQTHLAMLLLARLQGKLQQMLLQQHNLASARPAPPGQVTVPGSRTAALGGPRRLASTCWRQWGKVTGLEAART